MLCTIGLANVDHTQLARVCAQATGTHLDLLVFPENFSTEPEPIDGPLARHMCDVARQLGTWIVYAGRETNPKGALPYNTAVVIDKSGAVRASYQKCHLYDAHAERESERMAPGCALFDPVSAPFGSLGIGICYDLRFPEVARHAATRGCTLMVYPAAWHDGPCKLEHWKTLLTARAIENEFFVAGVCLSGERYVNESYVIDPLGRIRAQGSDALVVCTFDTAEVARTRSAMPVLEHRRPSIYL